MTFRLFAPLAALGAPIVRRLRAPRDPLPLPTPTRSDRSDLSPLSLPPPDVPEPGNRVVSGAPDIPAGRSDMRSGRTDDGEVRPDAEAELLEADEKRLRAIHRELGFPERPMRAGTPLRAPDCISAAAVKLHRYIMGVYAPLHGPTPPMRYAEIEQIYRAMCRRDHRKPAHITQVAGELLKIRGVVRNEHGGVEPDGRRTWTRYYQLGVPQLRKPRKLKRKAPAKPAAEVVPLRLAA